VICILFVLLPSTVVENNVSGHVFLIIWCKKLSVSGD